MKRFTTAFLMAAILALVSATAAFAQTRNCDSNGRGNRNNSERSYNDAYYQEQQQSRDNQMGYYDQSGYYDNSNYDTRSVYQRHRKVINYAISTGAGAIIGALIGGKRGALIGAAAGVAGGAIVSRKQRPTTYYRRY